MERLNKANKEYDDNQAKIKIENDRLKDEAERKEKLRIAEDKERKEKEEQKRKANELILQKEREEKQRIQRELEIKQEAERKEKQKILNAELEREKNEKAAQLAPDKQKLLLFADNLMKIELPKLQQRESNKILNNISTLISKIDSYIKDECKKL